MPFKDPARQREYQRRRAASLRSAHLNGEACADCDSTEDLQFHHRDPSEKVSHRVWSWGARRRREELAKCEVLCGRCHRRRHRQIHLDNRQHGRSNTYKNGCRCDACREAQRQAMIRYRGGL